jgi:thioredoxin reductase (NADPH)
MSEQARRYGADFIMERVEALASEGDGFRVITASQTRQARSILIATGVAVTHPPLSGLEHAIARGLVRYCPICDGFECDGKRLAVLAGKPASIEEAIFLKTYADDVTFLPFAQDLKLSREQIALAHDHSISIETRSPVKLSVDGLRVVAFFLDGAAENYDVLYPSLGSRPRSELAAELGAEVSPTGGLMVDSRQQTNLPMVYAAGDVLEGLDQIASACGQAAIAATAIHNHLRQSARKAFGR